MKRKRLSSVIQNESSSRIMMNNRFVNRNSLELENVKRNSIFDYEDSPSLTLEQAVKKIVPFVPNVMESVSIAKEKCNRSPSSLTSDESASIYIYSMSSSSFCFRLNAALRNEERNALQPWLAYLKIFINALERLPSERCVVWRGINCDASLTFVDNDSHSWWSVISCSRNIEVVKPFVGDKGTLFAIEAINGKDISEFSANKDEQEIILMPGTCLRRKAEPFNHQDGLFILHLIEILRQNELYEQVKDEYRENSRIESLMNPAKSFPITESYINLSIVTSREQWEKEIQLHTEQNSETIYNTFEEIYGTKTTININDIFKTCHRQKQQVLVFGRAGIGKSTFCRYIAYQWATDTSWSEYELLVLIPLRRLTTNRYPKLPNGQTYSLIDLIKKEIIRFNLSEEKTKLLKTQFNIEKTLWILDGYDEIVQNIPKHLQDLFEQLLKTPHHILTSRPYLNTLSYDIQLEINGFTDENIEQYIEQFFCQLETNSINKSQSLIKYLRSNQRIWGVAHIPVNLELICSVWSNEDTLKTKDLTITSLYNTMIEWLYRRYLTSKDKKEHTNEIELTFLEYLAFYTMKSNTIVIRPSLLKKAAKDANISFEQNPDILNLGILKSFHKPNSIGTRIETDKDHYFVHLSFQEYFAARYLIKAKEEAIEFLKYEKYNQHYTLTFSFLFGLLSENDLEFYWNVILEKPFDFIGIRHIQLIILCLEATSIKSNQLLQIVAQCIRFSFKINDQIFRKHLSYSLQKAPSLVCDPNILNVFIDLLDRGDIQTKSDVLTFISELKIRNPSQKLIQSIRKTTVDNERKEIRIKKCLALGSISEYIARKSVINLLIKALRDENNYARANAAYALGMVSKKNLTKKIIHKFMDLLMDGSENVRANASYVLERWKLKVITNKMIDKLVKLLGHKDKYVRTRVRYFFGNLAEHVPKEKLIKALDKKNKNIRVGVLIVDVLNSKQKPTNEIINLIIYTLKNTNENVRACALYVLGQMSEQIATEKMISKVINALEDESIYVRNSAYYLLADLNNIVINNEFINKLISALKDKNEDIRASACKALRKLSESQVTDEVMSMLLKALEDKSGYVRNNACETLGILGRIRATSEIIKKLIRLSNNDHFVVSNRAAEAVSHIVIPSFISNKLDFRLIKKVFSSKYASICSRNLSVDEIIHIYLTTKKSQYLYVMYRLALLQGIAITVNENKLLIYDTKEPHEIIIESLDLRQKLVQYFIIEAKRLQLDFRNLKSISM
ncbi:unnamed protein product [Adineta ricciae]|uniref:NAD(P)(+)--arginine ADP-ribosyltransferase n=1 Tax=Adineta ricciae TaxID=249248 RepID=A0A813S4Z6_ADIRI|nr:unnamed protein product [Adineta ricciae]